MTEDNQEREKLDEQQFKRKTDLPDKHSTVCMFSVSVWADKQYTAFLQGAELPEKNIVIGIGGTTLLEYSMPTQLQDVTF